MKTNVFRVLPLLLAAFLLLFVGIEASRANTEHNLYAPVMASNYNPAMAPPQIYTIDLELADTDLLAGEPLTMTVTTRDAQGQLAYRDDMQVSVEVNGRSRDPGVGPEDNLVALTDHQDGTYTGVYTDTRGTGEFRADTLVIYPVWDSKWDQVDSETFTIHPQEISVLELSQANPRQALIQFRDLYSNPVPPSSLTESEVVCMTDNPSLFNVLVDPDPVDPYWTLRATLVAQNYGHANMTCTHTESGASDMIELAYPPLNIFTVDPDYWPDVGFPAESFFDVFVEVPASPPMTPGWLWAEGTALVDLTHPVLFLGCESTDPTVYNVFCTPYPEGPILRIEFAIEYTGGGGMMVDSVPLEMNFQAPPVDPELTEPLPGSIQITDVTLTDPTMAEIPVDPAPFLPFWFWNWYFKPTKTLTMHIYIVQGAATQQEAEADAQTAENGFNLNALTCACPFFIDFNVVVTFIPAADWEDIDEDGDGLDRWDWNGDGDYDDLFENDDLQNAKDGGYFDSNAKTENVYYVPSIRGGAMGTTYAPNGQVAVDNGEDSDGLTLFHEKVHELDLRDDGDFDVNDSPDDNGNAQGARNPGNIMNYDNTGPWLTPTQCGHLDP
ncbi:MAG: hypothetical protein JW862_07130 [Anaerolineales bacterium]|nr:hypothetical protein [Anaerolineales bacterium]